jgi:hypothetical protein
VTDFFHVIDCEVFEFRCTEKGICMDISRWCDGQTDCPDDSDEPANCSNSKRKLLIVKLQCKHFYFDNNECSKFKLCGDRAN